MMEIDIGAMLRNAYEDGRKDGIAEAAPQWIPVSERLPESEDELYLGWDDRHDHRIVRYDGNNSWAENGEDGWCMVYVSHWMPLPEPPK